jgi:hypothetical protein
MKTNVAVGKIAENTMSTFKSTLSSIKTVLVSAASWTKTKSMATVVAAQPAVKKATNSLMDWLKTMWSRSKKNPIFAFGTFAGGILFIIDCVYAGIAVALLMVLYRACICAFVYTVVTVVEVMDMNRKKPAHSAKIPLNIQYA